MEKREFLYEGKAKQLYTTSDPNQIIILYKDDATAYNGVKRSSIRNKGILNNRITELIYIYLERKGIKTHFIKRLDEHSQLCKKLKTIPLEFIVRNVIAGSLSRRLDIEEGTIPKSTIYELCYKNDQLRDPFINETHALALGIISAEELEKAMALCKEINKLLIELFDKIGIVVIDFKIEFGKDEAGNIVLADEISPDSARFWDKETKKKLDKDRFRKNLGQIEESYREVLDRLAKIMNNE